ncbi:MAG: class I SAM-dependent methyltransferase [Lentisphaerota bacterium]
MPSMYEIYDNFALEYDELISNEDYEGNLKKFLDKNIKDGASVLELGTGTGRVTALYAKRASKILCCDRSAHMLQETRQKLELYKDKIKYQVLDNNEIDKVDGVYNVVIEGWAFGHTVIDQSENIEETVEKLVRSSESKVKEGGSLIFIETMGTNTEKPNPPSPILKQFYSILEDKYSFVHSVISTDYRFKNIDEAKRVMSFFFGPEMGNSITGRIVKEYTGIWMKS